MESTTSIRRRAIDCATPCIPSVEQQVLGNKRKRLHCATCGGFFEDEPDLHPVVMDCMHVHCDQCAKEWTDAAIALEKPLRCSVKGCGELSGPPRMLLFC